MFARQFKERPRREGDILIELVSLTQTRHKDVPAAKSRKHNAPAKCLSKMPCRSADDHVVNRKSESHCRCQDTLLPDAGIQWPSSEVQDAVYNTSLVHLALQSGPIILSPVSNRDHRLGQNIRMCATALQHAIVSHGGETRMTTTLGRTEEGVKLATTATLSPFRLTWC